MSPNTTRLRLISRRKIARSGGCTQAGQQYHVIEDAFVRSRSDPGKKVKDDIGDKNLLLECAPRAVSKTRLPGSVLQSSKTRHTPEAMRSP